MKMDAGLARLPQWPGARHAFGSCHDAAARPSGGRNQVAIARRREPLTQSGRPGGAELANMSSRDSGASLPDPGRLDEENLDRLLAAVARGEHGAFDLVYEQLAGPVYGAVRAVVRDPAQSEEVAQEVFLEVWRKAFRHDPGKGSAATWVLMIARRRAIDRVRSSVAAHALERRSAQAAPSWDQISETVEDAFDRERCRHCLDGLTDLQREAVLLAFYGGYTYPEVASTLGVPVGTAKSRIRDGLIRLRGCMQAPS